MDTYHLFYIGMLVISLILSAIFVHLWHKHFSLFFSLVFTFVPLVNLSYVFLAYAKNLEEAIIATKLNYLSACFLLFIITLYVFDMCQVTLPKPVIFAFVIVSIISCLGVLSISYSNLFYQDIKAHMENGKLVLEKVYGPLHTLFYVMIVVYFLFGLGAIFYSFLKKNQVSRRIIKLLFIPEIISIFCFFAGKIFFNGFELTPIGYVSAQITYLLIAHYTCLYDVSDMAIDSLTHKGETGFISFDFNLHYLGSNDKAREIFPDLNTLTVDKSLKKSKVLWQPFREWTNLFLNDQKNDKYYYNSGDYIYLVDINFLYHGSKKKGFQFIISDDTKNQKYIELLDNYNSDLEKEVEKKTKDIINMHNSMIRGMAMLVESRDNSTGGHIIRTSDVVEILLDEIKKDKEFVTKYNINNEFIRNLIKAAPLHDIGKIAIDDAILRKPGKFTAEEFEKMKKHAPEGARVLNSILEGTSDEKFKIMAENVAKYHHERMDGSGYPMGLKGQAIPLEARIMAIADVYDALVSKRVYKDSMSFENANKIMMESMGAHFDKILEKFYLAARPRIENYYIDKN